MRTLSHLFPLALLTAIITHQTASADVMFQGLGTLPGSWISFAQAVSGDGETVVGYCYLPPLHTPVAFRWTRSTGMAPLFDANSDVTGPGACAVSADGSVITGSTILPSGVQQAFRWTEGTGAIPLSGMPQTSTHSCALGVSSDGSRIVGVVANPVGRAFLWTATEGVTELEPLTGYIASTATAISANGNSIVGVAHNLTSESVEAFRWTAETGMVGLGTLPGSPQLTSARAVSADGSVVVGVAEQWNGVDGQAFRWTQEEGMVGLGFFPNGGTNSDATGVSGDGRLIVGKANNNDGDPPFIWDSDHGMRDLKKVLALDYGLDMSGWRLSEVTAISTDGRSIVGWGYDPLNQPQAWIAHIPEPSSVALFLACVGFMGSRTHRPRR